MQVPVINKANQRLSRSTCEGSGIQARHQDRPHRRGSQHISKSPFDQVFLSLIVDFKGSVFLNSSRSKDAF